MGLGTRVRRYSGARRAPQVLSQVAPTGMRDSLDPSTANDSKFQLLENCFPLDPEIGGGVWGRPGFALVGAQLGTAAARRGQRTYQFTKLNGTEYTVRFTGGKFYRLDWGTGVWTEIALAGGAALPASGRVYCTTFADQLIVNPHDGVNRPWAWDGAAFTLLSNAPVAYGPGVVHYGKLLWIKWVEPNTFVWSEELQPNVGYEATIGPVTYDNAWTLGQTDQERLYALLATNNALYYFRARSIGYVLGEVTANFRSTGTLEGVSPTIGTRSPDGVLLVGDSIYFVDADGHPQRLFLGGGFQDPPIWEDARETTRQIPKGELENAVALHWQDGNLVWFALPGPSASDPNQVLCFDAQRGEFVAVFRGYTATALDVVKNAEGEPTVMHLSADGYAYLHGHLWEQVWDDGFASGKVAISHKAHGTFQGFDTGMEKAFTQVDVSLRLASDLTQVKLRVRTPYGTGSELTLPSLSGSSSRWGSMRWGRDPWGSPSAEGHVQVGLDAVGRWCQLQWRHAVLGEKFGLTGWMLPAYPLGLVPETR